jgi:CDP-4-dehydro-6-deoxyglucose reductase
MSTKRLRIRVAALHRASPRTMILRLKLPADADFQYRPGQFIGLDAPDGRQRFFSIANARPTGDELELHVARAPGGAFTGALFEQAQVGDAIWMEGPFGDFAIPSEPPPKIILVAGGTGFAPIRACLQGLAAGRSAAAIGAAIHLYWGARSREDLYDLASVRALGERLPGLRFVAVLDQAVPDGVARTGRVHRAVIEDFDDLSDYEIYACGAPAMIEALSRDCAKERGFDPSRLSADVFVSGPIGGGLAPATGAPIDVILNGPDGPKAIAAIEGEPLLFPLKRAGLELPAVCGGNGACGTCRVHVAPAWRPRIAAPTRREARLLQFLGSSDGDRLSCRIPLTAALSGLEICACADNEGDAQ